MDYLFIAYGSLVSLYALYLFCSRFISPRIRFRIYELDRLNRHPRYTAGLYWTRPEYLSSLKSDFPSQYMRSRYKDFELYYKDLRLHVLDALYPHRPHLKFIIKGLVPHKLNRRFLN